MLLKTNTEVSIIPRPYRSTFMSTRVSATIPPSKEFQNDTGKQSTPSPGPSSVTLRVLPMRIVHFSLPEYHGPELLAYVSSSSTSQINRWSSISGLKPLVFREMNIKRLIPPLDPTIPGQAATESSLTQQEVTTKNAEHEDISVFVASLNGIPPGHIVMPTPPTAIGNWDIVTLTLVYDFQSTVEIAACRKESDIYDLPSSPRPFLPGMQNILESGIDYCAKQFFMQVSQGVFRGVSGLLVTGRNGTGKTSVTRAIAKSIQEDRRIFAYNFFVDMSRYAEQPVSTVKSHLRYWFEKAAWHRPSVLILDNLDSLLSAELEHTDSFRFRHLTESFLSIFSYSASRSSNSIGVVLLATAISTASLHSLVNSSHIFKEVINLHPPNSNARRAMLASLIEDRLSSTQDIQEDVISPINAISLATQTDGYSPVDLKDLVDRAIHQVAVKTSNSNIPAQLSSADFTLALANFVPHALRDVKLYKSEVVWSDIGGLHDVRRTLRETLEWPVKYGPIFAQSPLRLRSGLMLYGFPGCGKTLLASAVAKECGLNFLSVKGPEILNKYIGASEKSVRDLFERATAAKPCVLFFDEFDSIAPKRGHDSTGVTDRVVNQLLTQMDGAEGLDGVYILAATSRPDLIDPALLRPGRLDKSLFCNMPDLGDRQDILRAVSRRVTVSPLVDFHEIANTTEGFSGADLQALLYSSHLEAVHSSFSRHSENLLAHDDDHMQFSVIGGPAKKRVSSKADEMALQGRLKTIRASSKMQGGMLKPKNDISSQVEISMEHIRQALRVARPSVSPQEHARLNRVYQAFSSNRNGALPVPSNGSIVGGRVSLG